MSTTQLASWSDVRALFRAVRESRRRYRSGRPVAQQIVNVALECWDSWECLRALEQAGYLVDQHRDQSGALILSGADDDTPAGEREFSVRLVRR